MSYYFDEKKECEHIINWIKEYFKKNANERTKVVCGISGGKDSAIVTSLCVEALGKDRVYGVLMPNGEQHDIKYAYDLCEFLDIPYSVVNIKDTYNTLIDSLSFALDESMINSVVTNNTPARIRMTTLYGISAMIGGRVANTCNYSEDYVGYATKFGDGAGDFSPLSCYTVQEVKKIGRLLLPDKFIDKVPEDGLCGKTDEDNLDFTYEVLDRYIREGICEDLAIKEKIDYMMNRNLHKLETMPICHPLFA